MNLIDMFPRLSMNNHIYRCLISTKLSTQFNLRNAAFIITLSDFAHAVVIQYRLMVKYPILVVLALFPITHVISVCSGVEMNRVYAGRIITFVEHAKTVWHLSVGQFKSDAMGAIRPSSAIKYTVASFVFTDFPQPTPLSLFYRLPKTQRIALTPKAVVARPRAITTAPTIAKLDEKADIAVTAIDKYFRSSHGVTLRSKVAFWLEPFGCLEHSFGSPAF